ncbi:MAG: hypothetical protein H0X01_04370, partial [Nitrospira sp.]|nr:hypothetical protein [Nitrospira sp.]
CKTAHVLRSAITVFVLAVVAETVVQVESNATSPVALEMHDPDIPTGSSPILPSMKQRGMPRPPVSSAAKYFAYTSTAQTQP